mmetsp:Transcript_4871/g.18270  ORF Transcript_4871/g.18270 Transcript_4871/m.18270 type:complete len:210 (+) Transcript_4871:280-909(+)
MFNNSLLDNFRCCSWTGHLSHIFFHFFSVCVWFVNLSLHNFSHWRASDLLYQGSLDHRSLVDNLLNYICLLRLFDHLFLNNNRLVLLVFVFVVAFTKESVKVTRHKPLEASSFAIVRFSLFRILYHIPRKRCAATTWNWYQRLGDYRDKASLFHLFLFNLVETRGLVERFMLHNDEIFEGHKHSISRVNRSSHTNPQSPAQSISKAWLR